MMSYGGKFSSQTARIFRLLQLHIRTGYVVYRERFAFWGYSPSISSTLLISSKGLNGLVK